MRNEERVREGGGRGERFLKPGPNSTQHTIQAQ